jgi:hypothetical protein
MSFDQKITQFQRFGTYTYEFDEVGNVIINSSSADFSQVYVAFSLNNFIYNDPKIASFYDPTFLEFVPPATASTTSSSVDLQANVDILNQQNQDLQNKLNGLIAVNESTPSLADQQAAQQVILELRKSLGQGRVDSDFSNEFPYTPISKPENRIPISSTATAKSTLTAIAAAPIENNSGSVQAPISSPPIGISAPVTASVAPTTKKGKKHKKKKKT